ncbi:MULTISPECIES: aminoglycoside phosphotransferase family protein [unclassified Curtobacterium]|uniref:aminoglycoside phosphotransferase family protein n=1 Tax=unclassified Curtobacterium TaxID=257496 RepID=UPI00226B240E|nr:MULTISPECIES: aminoglycoside phosphotransferase family protein [unclassified Curtobacterium]
MSAAEPTTGRPTPEDARHWITADFAMQVAAIEEVSGGTDVSAVVWRFVDDTGDAWAAKWTTRTTTTGTRLVGSMADAGLDRAPGTVPTVDGRRRSRRGGGRLAVSRWSEGEDAATVGLDLDGWHAYGELLADVHAHAFPLPPRRQGARRGIRRRRQRYRAAIRMLDARPTGDDVLRLWRDARPRIALLQQGTTLASAAPGERVPCHGDPHLGNVLVEPDSGLRLVDWDEAVVAPRELDLHLVEFSVLFAPASPEELAAFRAGYGPVVLDEHRLVRYACVRALEDLTSTMTAALDGSDEDRTEALRVFTGILAPTGSASLVEDRLRAALADAATPS